MNSIIAGTVGRIKTFVTGAIIEIKPKVESINGRTKICADIVSVTADLMKFGQALKNFLENIFSTIGEKYTRPVKAKNES